MYELCCRDTTNRKAGLGVAGHLRRCGAALLPE